MSTTIQIDPRAALGEANAHVEFLRNRNLILANELFRVEAQLALLKPAAKPEGEAAKKECE